MWVGDGESRAGGASCFLPGKTGSRKDRSLRQETQEGGKDQDGGGKGIRPDLEVECEMPTWNRWSQNS